MSSAHTGIESGTLPGQDTAPRETHGGVVVRTRPQQGTKPKLLPPYAVVLHDDPINGFGYVMRTLRKVFHYNAAHAFMLTLRAHRTGRAAVWTGAKEHAEFRAEQLRSCGPDPIMAHRGAGSLGVSIEPLPGG